MGTRNLTCVVMNNEYKIAQYGQWDGNPSGQGLTILEFLRLPGSITNLSYSIGNITALNHNQVMQKFTDEYGYIEGVNDSPDIDKKFFNDHPLMSRDIGGDILQRVIGSNGGIVKNDLEFAANSLYCEWAYVIDIDKNTFEVFMGFNQKPLNESERFYFLNDFKSNEYCPVRHLKTYSLDALPTNKAFVKELSKLSGDEEEEVEEEEIEEIEVDTNNVNLDGGWTAYIRNNNVSIENNINDVTIEIPTENFNSVNQALAFATKVALILEDA